MSELEQEIRRLIEADGPMPMSRYMALCAEHYYATRDPFGARGDFITAPEVSQMFGELLGLWAAAVWQTMRSPAEIMLVELGPGRGTLMADALRAANALPEFRAALHIHLVETSAALVARQETLLAEAGVPIVWHRRVEELPEGRSSSSPTSSSTRCPSTSWCAPKKAGTSGASASATGISFPASIRWHCPACRRPRWAP